MNRIKKDSVTKVTKGVKGLSPGMSLPKKTTAGPSACTSNVAWMTVVTNKYASRTKLYPVSRVTVSRTSLKDDAEDLCERADAG